MPEVERYSRHIMTEVATSFDCFPRCPGVPKSWRKREWETSQGLLIKMQRKHRESSSGLKDTVASSRK